MDTIDKKIITILAENSRLSNVDLAEQLNLSPATTYRRVKNLEESEVIEKYSLILNKAKLHKNTQVIIRVTLDGQDNHKLEEFEQQVKHVPNVLACYLIGGDYDYLLRVVVEDIAHYEKLHKNTLSKLPYVYRIQSNFAIKEVVQNINPSFE